MPLTACLLPPTLGAMVDPPRAEGAHRVYFWGGVLLLASGVWMALSSAMEYGVLFDLYWALHDGGLLLVLQTVGILLPLAAALVFAFGSRDGGSVVAQSRLGIVAIAIFAVVPPLLFFVGELRGGLGDVADSITPIYLVLYLIQVTAGVVALREIARAGVIPRSRLWLPIAAVGIAALSVVLILIGMLSPGPSGLAILIYGLWDLGPVVLALAFGILAIANSINQGAGRV